VLVVDKPKSNINKKIEIAKRQY